MQIIRVFVASSGALKEERVQIENWISRENEFLLDRGVVLHLEKPSGSFTKTRKQEDFNKQAVNSQIFVCLASDRVGDFTREEFLKAYESFRKRNVPELILVYFKDAPVASGYLGQELETVLDLKKEITSLGQAWTEYSSIEGLLRDLRQEFNIYLDRLNSVQIRKLHSSLPNMVHFVGREKELAKIKDALDIESRAWGVMIVGPGGIGKTSLAVAAAHRAPENDFPIKVFLSAKMTALTAEGEAPMLDYALPDFDGLISQLAFELGAEDIKQTPVSERVTRVRHSLSEKTALIIFDDIDTFDKNERERLFQFLNRLPPPCKALVTSRRRRAEADTRTIRLDRLQLDEAIQLMNELAKENAVLARASENELQTLYEMAGGNPLLINWVCGQLARDGGGCNTISEACKLLESAQPGNDPLEFVFGNLLDTFGPTEIAVLSALTHFSQPAESDSIAVLAQLPRDICEAALDRLTDRALLDNDENKQLFFLPTLTATFLRRVRPEAVKQTGDRLLKNVYALVRECGNKKYESFPRLEAQWLSVAMALQLMQKSDNIDLQWFCDGVSTFLDFSGRQDEWLLLCQIAEEKASKAHAFNTAATRATRLGVYLRRENRQMRFLRQPHGVNVIGSYISIR